MLFYWLYNDAKKAEHLKKKREETKRRAKNLALHRVDCALKRRANGTEKRRNSAPLGLLKNGI